MEKQIFDLLAKIIETYPDVRIRPDAKNVGYILIYLDQLEDSLINIERDEFSFYLHIEDDGITFFCDYSEAEKSRELINENINSKNANRCGEFELDNGFWLDKRNCQFYSIFNDSDLDKIKTLLDMIDTCDPELYHD